MKVVLESFLDRPSGLTSYLKYSQCLARRVLRTSRARPVLARIWRFTGARGETITVSTIDNDPGPQEPSGPGQRPVGAAGDATGGEADMLTRHATQFTALLGMIAVLLLAGCSSDDAGNSATMPSGEEAGDQTINLDDPYGGFNTAAEDPAFGDESLAESALLEEVAADGYEGLEGSEREDAVEDENRPNRDFYSFTMMWGNLDERDANDVQIGGDGEPVDWSGGLTLEGGTIRLVSLLAFEHLEDYLVRPRNSRGELAWHSITRGGFDGVRVTLIVPAESEEASSEPVLQVRAAPLGEDSLEYSLAQLAELDALIEIPETGEQVSIRAFKAEPAVSVRGFTGGRWGYVLRDSTGQGEPAVEVRGFKGRWIAETGELKGFIRGHYGRDHLGQRVFFGKYIDETGAFRGFVRGHWRLEVQRGEASQHDYYEVGSFAGDWIGEQGDAIGRVMGHWSRRGARPGTFTGLWHGFAPQP